MKLVGRKAAASLIVVLGLLVMFSTASVALAGSVDGGIGMSLSCTAALFSGSGHLHYDRDTTGTGGEDIRLLIIDGNGSVITDINDAEPVGTALPFAPAYDFPIAPAANPIYAKLWSPAGNGQPEQTILSAWFDCPGLPNGSLAASAQRPPPGIPNGFVLRTIICDTPVYNQAAGTPVEGAKITLGQTWYVSPDYVYGSDGRNWSQIFAGGYTNGWIETRCIG